jgi:hypothetical protein
MRLVRERSFGTTVPLARFAAHDGAANVFDIGEMNDDEPRNAFERAARSLECPWYVAMMRDAETTLDDLAKSVENDENEDDAFRTKAISALSDIGVETKDTMAIVDHVLSSRARARAPAMAVTHGDARDVIKRTRGGIYDESFLSAIEPLYDLHMGAENMGPLLYAIARFCKPAHVLEVGAGYTSIFLLQAMRDNADEIATYRAMIQRQEARIGDVPWTAPDYDYEKLDASTLHIVDNCAHEHTTAHRVKEVAQALGCESFLRVHVCDAFDSELPSTLAVPDVKYFDLLWIDLGAANRIEGFFDAWWSRVNPCGGFVVVHSTLTNTLSRKWLEKMRKLARDGGRDAETGASPYGEFVTVSFLEPHKMFQNSCSFFQRRQSSWTERTLTKYP